MRHSPRDATDARARSAQQNKLYTPNGWREIVGSLDAKLEWARASGASALSAGCALARRFCVRHATVAPVKGGST